MFKSFYVKKKKKTVYAQKFEEKTNFLQSWLLYFESFGFSAVLILRTWKNYKFSISRIMSVFVTVNLYKFLRIVILVPHFSHIVLVSVCFYIL